MEMHPPRYMVVRNTWSSWVSLLFCQLSCWGVQQCLMKLHFFSRKSVLRVVSYRCFFPAFSQYQLIVCMCSVAWLSTKILHCPFLQILLSLGVLLGLPCCLELTDWEVAVLPPTLLCWLSISSATPSSFLRTVGFRSEGHRKNILLCYEITLQQQKGSLEWLPKYCCCP